MKEKPILFSGPMIRAILEGKKTQTRRVIKPQPDEDGLSLTLLTKEWMDTDGQEYKCPYSSIHNQLWIRETFTIESNFNVDGMKEYPPPFKDGRPAKTTSCPEYGEYWEQCHYRATDPEPELSYEDMEGPGCRWKPSIHMPRWASRINLEITDIRVERVQDISEEDAKAEGCEAQERSANTPYDFTDDGHFAVDDFASLWDHINGKPRADGVDISWSANPWVWVVTFSKL